MVGAPRRVPALLAITLACACGASAPVSGTPGAPVGLGSPRLAWAVGAFALVLPDGVRLAMDGAGNLFRDDAPAGRLESDGRVLDARGQALATLLTDGQLAYRGELRPLRVVADLPSLLGRARETVVRESSLDIVVLAEDRLRFERGQARGEVTVSFGPGSTELVRPAVVLVVALELLEHPRAAPRPEASR